MTVVERKKQLKECRAWVIIAVLQLLWILPVGYTYSQQEKAQESQMISEYEDVLRFRMEDVEIDEVTVEPLELYRITETPLYNIPLSENLQHYTFFMCNSGPIEASFPLAIMEYESNFNPNAIGDDGNSFGLMQIQPKWWQETMDRLGCDDLLDPYQNITVGVGILAHLIEINPDPYWVVMAYNMGPDKATELWEQGIYSKYAVEVVERASELSEEYESRREYEDIQNMSK